MNRKVVVFVLGLMMVAASMLYAAQVTGTINLSTQQETALLGAVNADRISMGLAPFATADAWANDMLQKAADGWLSRSEDNAAKNVQQAYKNASQAQKEAAWAALGMTPPAPAPPK